MNVIGFSLIEIELKTLFLVWGVRGDQRTLTDGLFISECFEKMPGSRAGERIHKLKGTRVSQSSSIRPLLWFLNEFIFEMKYENPENPFQVSLVKVYTVTWFRSVLEYFCSSASIIFSSSPTWDSSLWTWIPSCSRTISTTIIPAPVSQEVPSPSVLAWPASLLLSRLDPRSWRTAPWCPPSWSGDWSSTRARRPGRRLRRLCRVPTYSQEDCSSLGVTRTTESPSLSLTVTGRVISGSSSNTSTPFSWDRTCSTGKFSRLSPSQQIQPGYSSYLKRTV